MCATTAIVLAFHQGRHLHRQRARQRHQRKIDANFLFAPHGRVHAHHFSGVTRVRDHDSQPVWKGLG